MIEVTSGRAALCRSVLDDLPEWFGIPEAVAAYVAEADALPMLAVTLDGETAGFVSLKPQTEAAAEIHVMGVYRRFHRSGAGRALVGGAADWARAHGLRFLTVKTLAPSHPDPHYARTRRFYEAAGFSPLEEFPTLWGAGNPCLLMVKSVG